MVRSELESYESYEENNGAPYIEALLLTHIHLDHLRNIKFMDPQIPIIMSRTSKRIIKIIGEFNSDNDFLNHSFHVASEYSKNSYFPGELHKTKENTNRKIIIAESNSPIDMGNFKILGYPVDHSVPGAMAYKIETNEGKKIVYTGDLRFHGHENERKNSEKFVNLMKSERVDALITEGTRIDESKRYGEKDVLSDVSTLLQQDKNLSEKLIIVAFPWKGITRFKTVYSLAKKFNRTFIIQPKLAYMLHGLRDISTLDITDFLRNEDIGIFLPRKGSMTYSQADYTRTKVEVSYTTDWEKKSVTEGDIFYENFYERNDILVHAGKIHHNPSNYILHLDFYNLKHLIDILPPEHSYFFNLKTEPFDIEGELEEKVIKNWMQRFDLNYQPGFHASGHASGPEILNLIKKINPDTIFPVHTEHPELFPPLQTKKHLDLGVPYQI
jgi:ribonuclease J